VLVDSSHKKWIIATVLLAVAAVAVYLPLDWSTPGGLTGGSTVGLWYGIAGSALMVFAGLLSALRRVPSWWWIGSRKLWLKGHIWLGLLSGVLILCHSDFSWGGPLELALWIVLILTLATGVLGLALQQVLPRLITARVPREAPYEQIPHLCQGMRRRADAILEEVWKAFDPQMSQTNILHSQRGLGAILQLEHFYQRHVRPFLSAGVRGPSLLTNPLRTEAAFARFRALPGLASAQDQIAELEALCEERRQLIIQERLHALLHGWLLLHVPLSVLLLVLGIAHVLTALYY
jgi:hypothetical protein